MKINNSLKVARWELTKCICNHDDVEKCYPLSECIHCKCEEAWNSVPKKYFEYNNDKYDKDGKVTTKQTRIVKEITLVRGSKYQDIIGWTF